jgi:CheY-like chemotaxis protein
VGQGMGLGLSICHGIVTSLGGEIEVESEVGVGTVLRVILPPGPLAVGSTAKARAAPPAVGRARLLVIDDEPMFGATVARMVDGDHVVVVETSARSALSKIASGETFDVVLCDLMMPDLTGMEFFAELSQSGSPLAARVVFTTGGAFTGAGRQFLENVPNLRLSKPFTKREFESAVAAVLSLRAPPD